MRFVRARELAPAQFHCLAVFVEPRLERAELLLVVLAALHAVGVVGLERGHGVFLLADRVDHLDVLRSGLVGRLPAQRDFRIKGHKFAAGATDFFVEAVEFRGVFYDPFFHLHPEAGRAPDLLVEAHGLAIAPRNVFTQVRHALLGNGYVAVEPDDGFVGLGHVLRGGFELLFLLECGKLRLLDGRLGCRGPGPRHLALLIAFVKFFLPRVKNAGVGGVAPVLEPDLERLELVEIPPVPVRLFNMAREHAYLAVGFLHRVVDAQKVLPGAIELAQALPPALLVFADARGLFKQDAPFLCLVAQNGIYHRVFDGGVGGAAHAGVEEHGVDVAQPARHPVDEVFALTAAEDPPGDGDLVVFRREDFLRILYC